MFVVQERLNENSINIFLRYAALPCGGSPERKPVRFSIVLATLRRSGAYNFLTMQEEKLNAEQVAIRDLLYHVWEMIPANLDERETMRDHLKEIYLNFMHDEGSDLREEKPEFISLYFYFDQFLKLCKNVDGKEFHQFLKEKGI